MTHADLVRENAVLQTTNSELVHVNEALIFSVGRYLALHDLAPVPLITVDAMGVIMDANLAAESLLRAPRARLLGRNVTTYVVDGAQSDFTAQLRHVFGTGGGRGVELRMKGETTAIEVSIDAVVLPGKPPRQAVLACVDVTARNADAQARQEAVIRLQEAQRLQSLGVLAGGIAQRFNNLIAVMLTGAESVALELPAASPHADALSEVVQAARQAGDLAHQMLAYSGHASVPVHPVDLGMLVRELQPLLRAAARATSLVVEIEDGPLAVMGDEQQLRQVALNLVLNAAEAMVARPGAITLTVRRGRPAQATKDHVLLEVRDVGIGMDAATSARIFEPYFSTKFAGRGLGLAVVHGVVRGHDGITEIATSPGAGTALRIFLPAIAPPPAPRLPPVLDASWRAAGVVLLVDDDASIRRTVTRLLVRIGLTVIEACGAPEALAALAAGPVDLVMTDLTMPDIDGIALAQTIRATHPALPIVLVTGFGDTPATSADLFDAALAKPFELTALRAMLQQLLPATGA